MASLLFSYRFIGPISSIYLPADRLCQLGGRCRGHFFSFWSSLSRKWLWSCVCKCWWVVWRWGNGDIGNKSVDVLEVTYSSQARVNILRLLMAFRRVVAYVGLKARELTGQHWFQIGVWNTWGYHSVLLWDLLISKIDRDMRPPEKLSYRSAIHKKVVFGSRDAWTLPQIQGEVGGDQEPPGDTWRYRMGSKNNLLILNHIWAKIHVL